MTVTINGTNGVTTPEVVLDNSAADGAQVVLKSSGYSDWNLDNYSGRLRGYYGSTEYWTVNASGNVGVGTSSPSVKLDVRGIVRVNEDNAGTKVIQLRSDWAGVDPAIQVVTNNSLLFVTNGSERARIDSSGNLLVGTTSGSATRLSVVPAVGNAGVKVTQAGAGDYCYQAIASNNGGSFYFHYFVAGSTYVGQITSNGTTTSYTSASDYRLKHDIQPMSGALARVAALKPVTYKWNADNSDGEGFIAHELQEVVPECVTGEKDGTRIEQYEISPAVPATYDEEGNELTPAVEAVMGEREVPVYQGIDTSFLVATLTAAIQEQQAIITALTARVTALENQP